MVIAFVIILNVILALGLIALASHTLATFKAQQREIDRAGNLVGGVANKVNANYAVTRDHHNQLYDIRRFVKMSPGPLEDDE